MQQRREFIKRALLVGLASGTVSLSAKPTPKPGPVPKIAALKPKRLAAGQTIGLVAPSSGSYDNESVYYARDILRSFGFKVKEGKNLYQRRGYLAGEDKLRAADVNAMFADQSVDAIFCLRGGYGSPRILPYLDYNLIRKNPKVIIGFSDVTALLNAIYAKTGLITFHGVNASQSFSEYTLKSFKDVLFNPMADTTIAVPPPFEVKEGRAERSNRLTVITPGVATGKLIGGNLSLMVKLVGTPYEPDYRGKILFLEDVREEPYKMDGMLTHLKLAGRLDQVSGIAFGKCSKCVSDGNTLSMEQVLLDHLEPLGVPTITGLMIGHIKDKSTIPVGLEARLDTNVGGIKILESAVT